MPEKETVIDLSQFPQPGSEDFEFMPIDEYDNYDLYSIYVLEATAHTSGKWFTSKIPCEEFSGEFLCGGDIELIRYDLPSQIKWRCKKCKKRGKIINFEETVWDISNLPEDEQQQRIDSFVDMGDPIDMIEQLPDDDLQDFLGFFDNYMNNIGVDMREGSGGLNTQQLYNLLESDWESPDSLLKLNDELPLKEIDHSLLFHNARVFLHYMKQQESLPCTAAGNLKRKTVEALIERLRWPEGHIESIRSHYTAINEKDVWLLHVTRILLDLAGLIHHKKSAFHLTKKRVKLLEDKHAGQLYCRLIQTYFMKMNMGYLSNREDFAGLQDSASYTLYKLSRLDNHWQSIEDTAGDILLPLVHDQLDMVRFRDTYVYSLLIRPLAYFGLLETRNSRGQTEWPNNQQDEFRKKPLFDQLFTFDIEKQQQDGLNGNVIPLNNKSFSSKEKNPMKKVKNQDQKIYQLKISLNNIKPPIWRRLLVYSDTLLPDLHKIIQSSMGWYNGHLHQFEKNGQYYSPPSPVGDDWPGLTTIDYQTVQIDDLLSGSKQKMIYEYDFGDGWRHTILLEKTLPIDPDMHYPVCIKGKRNCPPEDCGGPWGYQEMLEAVADPGHPEHEMYNDWIGPELDPEYFDKDRINNRLRSKNYGVFSFF